MDVSERKRLTDVAWFDRKRPPSGRAGIAVTSHPIAPGSPPTHRGPLETPQTLRSGEHGPNLVEHGLMKNEPPAVAVTLATEGKRGRISAALQ